MTTREINCHQRREKFSTMLNFSHVSTSSTKPPGGPQKKSQKTSKKVLKNYIKKETSEQDRDKGTKLLCRLQSWIYYSNKF